MYIKLFLLTFYKAICLFMHQYDISPPIQYAGKSNTNMNKEITLN